MKRYIISMVYIFAIFAAQANSIKGWKVPIFATATNTGYGDLIIDGCTLKNCTHGTWDDEWGIVSLVAVQAMEHGGYFCPYQLQCAHKGRDRYVDVFYPIYNGNWSDKCAWLCEAGYSGPNCLQTGTSPAYCDVMPFTTDTDGRYNSIKLKTSGKRANVLSIDTVAQFASFSSEDLKFLGAIKRLAHGIVAKPIYMKCNTEKSMSYIADLDGASNIEKLLCAPGYTANASNTDCVAINPDVCTLQNIKMCANFDKGGYDGSIHMLEESGGCAKFFCKEPGTAFPSAGKYTCEDCGPGIKGGADPTNGVCVKCQTGQFFDKSSNSCKKAKAFTKTDLQYGHGQTKNSRELNTQCWTIANSDEYKKCVFGDK